MQLQLIESDTRGTAEILDQARHQFELPVAHRAYGQHLWSRMLRAAEYINRIPSGPQRRAQLVPYRSKKFLVATIRVARDATTLAQKPENWGRYINGRSFEGSGLKMRAGTVTAGLKRALEIDAQIVFRVKSLIPGLWVHPKMQQHSFLLQALPRVAGHDDDGEQ